MKTGLIIAGIFTALAILNTTAYSQVEKTVRIKNMTGGSISSVRISQNDQYNWSLPLNTAEKVADNGSFDYKRKVDTSNCIYDFKFTYEDGQDYIMEDLNLCEKDEIQLLMPKKEN